MATRWLDAGLVLAGCCIIGLAALAAVLGLGCASASWLTMGLAPQLIGVARLLRASPSTAPCLLLPVPIPDASLADQLAGIGRWSIDLATGRHRWSQEFCRLAGLELSVAPEPEVLRTLLPDGVEPLLATFIRHRFEREPYTLEFEIENPRLGTRLLRAQACNAPAPRDEPQLVLMVVRDVTEEYAQVARIQQERVAALREAEEARRMANTDALTGLPNRRSAMMALDREIMRTRRDGDPLALIVFDVDHFKAINDTHGHTAGDRVLAEIGTIIRGQMREGQCGARVGGEEFVLVLPGASLEVTAGAAERLRVAIERGTQAADVPPATVSVGYATLRPGDTSLTLFARADAALYEAKRAGRNRVQLAA